MALRSQHDRLRRLLAGGGAGAGLRGAEAPDWAHGAGGGALGGADEQVRRVGAGGGAGRRPHLGPRRRPPPRHPPSPPLGHAAGTTRPPSPAPPSTPLPPSPSPPPPAAHPAPSPFSGASIGRRLSPRRPRQGRPRPPAPRCVGRARRVGPHPRRHADRLSRLPAPHQAPRLRAARGEPGEDAARGGGGGAPRQRRRRAPARHRGV